MISFRSGNPALRSKTFKMDKATGQGVMTLEGTVNKTTISLFILLITAFYSYTNTINSLDASNEAVVNTGYMLGGFIGGFIVALVTIFKKEWSPYTVPLYAALEGLALGGISAVFNEKYYDGIAGQAILLTVGIFAALLFAYKSRIIQPNENFKLGIFAATAGIGIAYLINFIMSFWGSGLSVMNIDNASPMSIGFSVVVIIIASLNLVLDFDFIEQGSEAGIPKYMEWYGAFGLLVTLIWLYLEILRLLAKLQSRR